MAKNSQELQQGFKVITRPVTGIRNSSLFNAVLAVQAEMKVAQEAHGLHKLNIKHADIQVKISPFDGASFALIGVPITQGMLAIIQANIPGFILSESHIRIDKVYAPYTTKIGRRGLTAAHCTIIGRDVRFGMPIGVVAQNADNQADNIVIHLYFDEDGRFAHTQVKRIAATGDVALMPFKASYEEIQAQLAGVSEIIGKLISAKNKYHAAAAKRADNLELELGASWRKMHSEHKSDVERRAAFESYKASAERYIQAIEKINEFHDKAIDSRGQQLWQFLRGLQQTFEQKLSQDDSDVAEHAVNVEGDEAHIELAVPLSTGQQQRMLAEKRREKYFASINERVAVLLQAVKFAFAEVVETDLVSILKFNSANHYQVLELYCLLFCSPDKLSPTVDKDDGEFIRKLEAIVTSVQDKSVAKFKRACIGGDVEAVKSIYPYVGDNITEEFFIEFILKNIINNGNKPNISMLRKHINVCDFLHAQNHASYAGSVYQLQYFYYEHGGVKINTLIACYLRNVDAFDMLLRHGFNPNAVAAVAINQDMFLTAIRWVLGNGDIDGRIHGFKELLAHGASISGTVGTLENKFVEELGLIGTVERDLYPALQKLHARQEALREQNLKGAVRTSERPKALERKVKNTSNSTAVAQKVVSICDEEQEILQEMCDTHKIFNSIPAFMAYIRDSSKENLAVEVLAILTSKDYTPNISDLVILLSYVMFSPNLVYRLSDISLIGDARMLMFSSKAEADKHVQKLSRDGGYKKPTVMILPNETAIKGMAKQEVKFMREDAYAGMSRAQEIISSMLGSVSLIEVKAIYDQLLGWGHEAEKLQEYANADVFYNAAFLLFFLKPAIEEVNIVFMLRAIEARINLCKIANNEQEISVATRLLALSNIAACSVHCDKRIEDRFFVLEVGQITLEALQIRNILLRHDAIEFAGRRISVQSSASIQLGERIGAYAFENLTLELQDELAAASPEAPVIIGDNLLQRIIKLKLPTGLFKKDFRDKFGVYRCRIKKATSTDVVGLTQQIEYLRHIKAKMALVTVEDDYEKPGYLLLTAPCSYKEELSKVVDHWQEYKKEMVAQVVTTMATAVTNGVEEKIEQVARALIETTVEANAEPNLRDGAIEAGDVGCMRFTTQASTRQSLVQDEFVSKHDDKLTGAGVKKQQGPQSSTKKLSM